MSWAKQTDFTDEDFFLKVVMCNGNRLLERIWRIVNSYAKESILYDTQPAKEAYLTLLTYLQKRNESQMIATYSKLIRNMSKSE